MSGETLVHSAKDLDVRRGLRAAIALPGVLAVVDAATGNETGALFAAFAAFALVAMADFGGPPRARATSYLLATLLGAVLIVIGTLVSGSPIVAGIVTLVVTFVIVQVAAFGGAWGAGMFATTLAYVLAATLEAPVSELPDRLWGWGVGGLIAAAMALLLWPAYERPALWSLAVDALRACAELVRAAAEGGARAAAQRVAHALRVGYETAPYRPSGPAVRDRAFVALVEGLERLTTVEPGTVGGPTDDQGAVLRGATAVVLDAAADYVDARGAPEPDLRALDRARREHRVALGEWAGAALREGMPADEVLTAVEGAWWSRVVSFITVAVAADAVIGRGGAPLADELADTLQTPIGETGGWRARAARVLRANLDLGSIRFRNSLRTAVGLALAVLIAGLASVDHAFWVGLAALSVLRSNALATGRTALEAVGGTCLGFAVVLVFFGIFDAGPTAEWVALPIASFLAAFAPSAISFLVGQASFTVAIVLLFDVIEPEGWRTGAVRVEDIAIGAGVSLVVGLLMWPRGAIGMLRRVLGSNMRADADYLDAAMRGVMDGREASNRRVACEQAIGSSRRVADTYDDLLAAPGTLPPGHAVWASIGASARQVQAAGDLLTAQARLGFSIDGVPDATPVLGAESDRLTAQLRAEADAVEGGVVPPPEPPEAAARRRAAQVQALEEWGGRDDAQVSAMVGIVWVGEVLHATELAVRHAGDAVAEVAPARRPAPQFGPTGRRM